MAGIIVHIEVGSDKSTEVFSQEKLAIGSVETCDLQIQTSQVPVSGVWIELEDTEGVFRVIRFAPEITLTFNDQPIRRYIAVGDGDVMKIDGTDIAFSFFEPSTSLRSFERTATFPTSLSSSNRPPSTPRRRRSETMQKRSSANSRAS